jgi:hypothetical protein
VTERPASPDFHPGLADRIAAWLFPSYLADVPAARSCTGPCAGHDHLPAKPEPELEAEL